MKRQSEYEKGKNVGFLQGVGFACNFLLNEAAEYFKRGFYSIGYLRGLAKGIREERKRWEQFHGGQRKAYREMADKQ